MEKYIEDNNKYNKFDQEYNDVLLDFLCEELSNYSVLNFFHKLSEIYYYYFKSKIDIYCSDQFIKAKIKDKLLKKMKFRTSSMIYLYNEVSNVFVNEVNRGENLDFIILIKGKDKNLKSEINLKLEIKININNVSEFMSLLKVMEDEIDKKNLNEIEEILVSIECI